MTAIGPGDYVEYVGTSQVKTLFHGMVCLTRAPAISAIRVVLKLAAVAHCGCGERHPWLVMTDDSLTAWCPGLWRPVYRPKAEIFAGALKARPVDAPLVEKVA